LSEDDVALLLEEGDDKDAPTVKRKRDHKGDLGY